MSYTAVCDKKQAASGAAGKETALSILERLSDPELLNQMGLGQKLAGSLITAVIGMAVCMVVLAIIMLAIRIMHALMSRGEPAPAQGPAPEAAKTLPPPPEIPTGASGVSTPCAGTVKTLNASEGAVVREGDVLLLMEAGGAVFQFPAPAAGTVKRLCVSPGDSVEAGQVLVILKDKEDGDNA